MIHNLRPCGQRHCPLGVAAEDTGRPGNQPVAGSETALVAAALGTPWVTHEQSGLRNSPPTVFAIRHCRVTAKRGAKFDLKPRR